jgi:hypothetical protein
MIPLLLELQTGRQPARGRNVCDPNLADPERLYQGLVWGKIIGASSHTLCGRAISARDRVRGHHHRQEVTKKKAVLTARCFGEPQTIASKFFIFIHFQRRTMDVGSGRSHAHTN